VKTVALFHLPQPHIAHHLGTFPDCFAYFAPRLRSPPLARVLRLVDTVDTIIWHDARGKQECDLNMMLECPYCKKNYRLDPSPFTGWKSARVRCRICGKGFTIVFPATEPTEPPRQSQALTLMRGTPGTASRSGTDTHVSPVSTPEPSPRSLVQPVGAWRVLVSEEPDTAILPCPPGAACAAGDTLSVPPSEAQPTYLLQAHKIPHGKSQNIRPLYSAWQLLVVPAIFVACGLSLVAIIVLLIS